MHKLPHCSQEQALEAYKIQREQKRDADEESVYANELSMHIQKLMLCLYVRCKGLGANKLCTDAAAAD